MSDWIPIVTELPLWNQDVLVYSVSARGYAVAQCEPTGPNSVLWKNSTNGLPFRPAPTHWMKLPAPPSAQGASGYESYGNN